MCKLLEIEYSCSHGTKRHRQRIDALCSCDNPLACMVGDMQHGNDPKTKIEDLGKENFKVVKVDGVCDECAQKMAQEIEEKDMMFGELEASLEEINKDLALLALAGPANGHEAKRHKLAHRESTKPQHTPHDGDWICASGSCQGRVTFSIDGRRGRFCQKHTCAAQDWGCISGVATKLNSPQFSIYCHVHTCNKAGCGMRIAHDSALYCCTHSHMSDLVR
ncbi:hypothetical protein BHE90_001737 [Fusarium euwallaceae]|uniref:Uncharacterized protein n=2 Tax=Fusarium solani species complex TaxID=232080 RepID=A0A428TLQ3_9HYPO|nr:hypothetical protein CEP52_007626 [Fusarium oligoseptatum]RTE83727.1 hypothetical protein BHE90_001737 [Fusarium euwallaceae]